MGWWFGRKSAPADARPFVPAWLCSDTVEEGFARSADGVTAYVRSTRSRAIYRDGEWALSTGSIASPAGGTTVDSQARSAIDQMLGALRQHGLIAS
jgi:hypothetical protein